MPELPEVETVKNSLKDIVIGEDIVDVIVRYPNIIANVDVDYFINELKNETFKDVLRVGKYLVFLLNNHILLSHLRMEGKYILKESFEYTKHDHVIFIFKNGKTFRYNDVRKFGKMFLFNTTSLSEVCKVEPLVHLGLEPFDCTIEYLKEKLKTKNIPIKTVLLDQAIISGLGNIYADEVCFMAGFSPLKKASLLTDEEIQNVISSSIIVLNKAIKLGGTTIRSFQNAHEITGRFQNELLVHTKDICPKCSEKIIKKFVGGRGTYYCPNCQNLEKGKKIVAITGGISSGKSLVSSILRKLDYKVIDCDELSHEALLINSKTYKEIIKEFNNITNEDGNINHKLLADIIFNDISKKRTLEKIIHPYVIKRMYEEINKVNDKLVFIEIPLLFEAKLEDLFDIIIVVGLDTDKQIERLMKRNNIDYNQANNLINNQMPLKDKMKLANYVIDNNGSIDEVNKQIKNILEKLEE